jgi:hypothetical protein
MARHLLAVLERDTRNPETGPALGCCRGSKAGLRTADAGFEFSRTSLRKPGTAMYAAERPGGGARSGCSSSLSQLNLVPRKGCPAEVADPWWVTFTSIQSTGKMIEVIFRLAAPLTTSEPTTGLLWAYRNNRHSLKTTHPITHPGRYFWCLN